MEFCVRWNAANGISELLVVAVVVREVLLLLVVVLPSGTIRLLILCRKLVIMDVGSSRLASIEASVLILVVLFVLVSSLNILSDRVHKLFVFGHLFQCFANTLKYQQVREPSAQL